MSLKPHMSTPSPSISLTSLPLGVTELQQYAEAIIEFVCGHYPEYNGLVHLQRNAGNRITEMFQSYRWTFPTTAHVQIKPQKGNATRVLSLSELGYSNAAQMQPVLADMNRLPKNQYERAFSYAVHNVGLWRLYEKGYTHPSTHFFRHLKIKELNQEGYDQEYIANWIGEKNVNSLDYYLESQFFGEVE